MADRDENLRLAFDCLRPFFPDRDALSSDVFKDDPAKMEQVCGILRQRVRARKITIQSLKKQLPRGKKQEDAEENSSDTCDHDEKHLNPDFVPLHTIVDTLRASKDAEHVKDGTICIELAEECLLPKAPEKGCTCMRINDGSIKYHEDDERDMARGYGFVNGHALFACDFSTYSTCMQERIKESVALDLGKEEHAANLSHWLAEALVMRLAFLGMESKGKFLVQERAYAENENCFETSVFFNVCQDEESWAGSDEECACEDDDGEECKRGHYLFLFRLRVSEDGRLVKLRHSDLYGDCMAEEHNCQCEGCVLRERKRKRQGEDCKGGAKKACV